MLFLVICGSHFEGADFTDLSNDDIIKIQEYLNNRSRKLLGYLTTNEIFAKKAAE